MVALSFAGLCQAPTDVLSRVSIPSFTLYSPLQSHLHRRTTENRAEIKDRRNNVVRFVVLGSRKLASCEHCIIVKLSTRPLVLVWAAYCRPEANIRPPTNTFSSLWMRLSVVDEEVCPMEGGRVALRYIVDRTRQQNNTDNEENNEEDGKMDEDNMDKDGGKDEDLDRWRRQ